MARPPILASASTASLGRELRGRALLIAAFERRRADLLAEIAAIERELVSLGVAPPPLPRPGAPRPDRVPLPRALEAVLRDRPMGVTELAEEVLRRGYRTTSIEFRRVVNKTLLSDARFVGVSRGVYALRGARAQR